MERLTFDGNFCEIAQCRDLPCQNGGSCSPRKVWERLKEYEDSGLEPDEIKYIKLMAMRQADAENSEFAGVPIERLKELALADKAGRVMVLPCKVGDTVYELFSFRDIDERRVGQFRLVGYARPDLIVDLDLGGRIRTVNWSEEDGKTIFRTREEAEAKLKEVQKDG